MTIRCPGGRTIATPVAGATAGDQKKTEEPQMYLNHGRLGPLSLLLFATCLFTQAGLADPVNNRATTTSSSSSARTDETTTVTTTVTTTRTTGTATVVPTPPLPPEQHPDPGEMAFAAVAHFRERMAVILAGLPSSSPCGESCCAGGSCCRRSCRPGHCACHRR